MITLTVKRLVNLSKTKLNNRRDKKRMIKFLVFTLVLAFALTADAQSLQGKFNQTRANNVRDVAVGSTGTIWIVKTDGTIQFSDNGRRWTNVDANGFNRISAQTDDLVYCVGSNGTLWRYDGDEFTQTKAEGMVDVAVSKNGRIWAVGKNETVWFSDDEGENWKQTDANGFRNLSVGADDALWATGANGTLWSRNRGNWKQTQAEGMSDLAAGTNGQLFLVGSNGTFWISKDRGRNFNQVTSRYTFSRIASGLSNEIYLVDSNGKLWKYQ